MSIMQKRLLISTSCVVFGCSLLAHLPAQLVIPERSGNFQFIGVSGSLWQGNVSKILFSSKIVPIRNLNWSVRPLALLTGTVKADFSEQWTPVNRGSVGMSLFSRTIEFHELHWQASSKSFGAANLLQGVKARGDVVLNLETLQFPADMSFPSQMGGQLDWQNAELQINSQYLHIGSPVMQFSGEDAVMKGVITNTQPLLPGEGSFQCTTKNCQVELDLQPTPDTPQSVLTGLLLLGLQQTGDRFSGQFAVPLD